MKLVLVALSVVIACTYGATNFQDWKVIELYRELWTISNPCTQAQNGKSYEGKEKSEDEAKSAFNKTVAAIRKHNADSTATYQQGVNENSDMTDEEKQKRNGYKHSSQLPKNVKGIKPVVKGTTPASFNATNMMGPVKNQGVCGKIDDVRENLQNRYSPVPLHSIRMLLRDGDTLYDQCNEQKKLHEERHPSVNLFGSARSGLRHL